MAPPEPLQHFPLCLELPVLWGDQDAFGHVNNTLALRWFESSRIAYLEASGLDRLMADMKLGPILAAASCNYRRQITYPDRIWIGATVQQIGRSSMVMHHEIYTEANQAVATDGTSTVVLFDYQANRPRRVPDPMRTVIAEFEGRAKDSAP